MKFSPNKFGKCLVLDFKFCDMKHDFWYIRPRNSSYQNCSLFNGRENGHNYINTKFSHEIGNARRDNQNGIILFLTILLEMVIISYENYYQTLYNDESHKVLSMENEILFQKWSQFKQ